MPLYTPTRNDRFTFGLWTVGNTGRDPFGDATRERLDPVDAVAGLAKCGAYGVNLHDDDLIPHDASHSERNQITERFKRALSDHGLVVPMATTNLFTHPIFKDGAFTSKDARVRAYAVQKTMRAMDLGVELGAKIYVFWGGREGAETDAAKDPRKALVWMRECINFLCEYAIEQRYELKFALEPKPNEPRGDLYLPTVGHMLHFITTLVHPAMVGVNPEVAHESMAGLSFVHGVAQAMEAGKLFHIDLNAQRIGRFDQDLRFGSEDLRQAFLLVRLLEGTGGGGAYHGPLHFDSHAYRTEDLDGVWDFVRGSMRTYLILKEKARQFDSDPEVQGLISETHNEHRELCTQLQTFTPGHREALRKLDLGLDSLARQGAKAEALDQLMMEHLMGVRGERA